MTRAGNTALDPAALEAAAQWYVQFQDTTGDASLHAAWQHWLDARPEHRRAWARMQTLDQRLRGVPAELALPSLRGADKGRRAALKALTLLLIAGPAAWTAQRTLPWQSWTAQYRTQAGERSSIALSDGSQVQLNTATALDVDFSQQLRLLRLHRGEILIQTAADAAQRPFIVNTGQGTMRALGTRFSVRTDAETTRLSVIEHAVEVRTTDTSKPVRLEAGQQLVFSSSQLQPVTPVDANADAWTRGMLVAIDWRLDHFLAELSRYRAGHIGCDPAVASLRVSGAFRLDDIDGALDNLAASLPIQLKLLSRYWVRVVAR